MIYAIIPARSGSQRIKNKNIKNFFGKPIIYYPINESKKAKIFDRIIVSTDSNKIVNISKNYGAECPFLRPKKLSGPKIITADVILHVVKRLKLKNDDYICCIYPTAVFLNAKELIAGFKKLKKSNYDGCISVTKYDFPIQRSMHKKNDNVFFNYKKYVNYRSQSLVKNYHDAAQFYWFKVKSFLKHKSLYPKKLKGIEISSINTQDIDDKEDFELAKLKFQRLKK